MSNETRKVAARAEATLNTGASTLTAKVIAWVRPGRNPSWDSAITNHDKERSLAQGGATAEIAAGFTVPAFSGPTQQASATVDQAWLEKAMQLADAMAESANRLSNTHSNTEFVHLRDDLRQHLNAGRVDKTERRFAGWFREQKSGMSYRLWEQGGHEQQAGEVALYE